MTWLNPDCAGGKHGSCAGDAWDDGTDQRTTCGCACHSKAILDDFIELGSTGEGSYRLTHPNIVTDTLRYGFP